MKLFVHGIPDTPIVWSPIRDAIGPEHLLTAPALPGLVTPAPAGFRGTPEAFVDWLVGEIESAFKEDGPVDLVGHDWGALFVVRAACLRPDLVRTWTAISAVPDPDDPWPLIARLWATPVLGRILMALSPASEIEKALVRQRMSEGMAAHEAVHWRSETRRAILKLYRTGMKVGASWEPEMHRLPKRGLVIWGEKDPYAAPAIAERFCARTGADLEIIEGSGHLPIVEAAPDIATRLLAHWKGFPAGTS